MTFAAPAFKAIRMLTVAFLASLVGCVRVYQPMSGLYDPVIVRSDGPNLQGVNLTVHCVPQDLLDQASADELCRMVSVLFENQGAHVETITSVAPIPDAGATDGVLPSEAVAPTADLEVELRARKLHQARYPLLRLFCIASFTLIPAVDEYTFSQDVVIRDSSGFLLASTSLEGRLVSQFGIGVYLGNIILDRWGRSDAERVLTEVPYRGLSEDMYRHLSQLVFDAKLQWQVLRLSDSNKSAN